MHTSNGKTSTQLVHGDRHGEFVAVVEAVLPDIGRHLQTVANLGMVAAFWGVVMYLALVAFALQ